MTYLYMLYDYDEHGPENLIATLDKSLVLGLFDKYWPDSNYSYANHMEGHNEDRERLKQYLLEDDEDLVKYERSSLNRGWGGVVLHVVVLK